MRGSSNENVALSSLEEKDGVHIVCEIGLIMKRDEPYFECWPDGVARLNLPSIEGASGWVTSMTATWEDANLRIIPVESKSRISENSLSDILCPKYRYCAVYSNKCRGERSHYR